MKKAYMLAICYLFLSLHPNAQATVLEYDLIDIGAGQFQYEYTVTNNTLAVPIEEFTIWFDVDSYDNLAITTEEPLASQWDEIILERTGFGLPIGYDAKSVIEGIQVGQTVGGFSVTFDSFGTGTPGPQFFEIINPTTFETIDSGYTVPEPATVLLFGFGVLVLRRKSKP